MSREAGIDLGDVEEGDEYDQNTWQQIFKELNKINIKYKKYQKIRVEKFPNYSEKDMESVPQE